MTQEKIPTLRDAGTVACKTCQDGRIAFSNGPGGRFLPCEECGEGWSLGQYKPKEESMKCCICGKPSSETGHKQRCEKCKANMQKPPPPPPPPWFTSNALRDWTTNTPTETGTYFLCKDYDQQKVKSVTIKKFDKDGISEAENIFPSYWYDQDSSQFSCKTWLWYGPLEWPPLPEKPPMKMEEAVAMLKSHSDDKRYAEAVAILLRVVGEAAKAINSHD